MKTLIADYQPLWFSIAHKGEILLSKKIKTDKPGVDAQLAYTNQVIDHLRTELLHK